MNKAVGLLKESGFVTQQPYGGILLTEEGKAVAAKVRMCHSTIKILLQQLFGVPKETAEAEACKIEHVISDDTLSRLIDFVKKNFDKNLMTNVHANYDIKSNIYGNLPQAEDGVAVKNVIGIYDRSLDDANDICCDIVNVLDSEEKARICTNILESLPDWFGIPSAINDYAKKVRDLPFWCAVIDGKPVGFVSVKIHHGCTAELLVMAVDKKFHRKGIGRKLVKTCKDFASDKGCVFLTVKTLSSDNNDVFYEQTRLFYLSMGFYPLETFTQIWGEADPCLLMGMYIG